jgi:DNA-directed RNA polymerase subunit RPC12/RpoP
VKERLEKQYKQPVAPEAPTEKRKTKCPKCNFEFVYNLSKGTPVRCPYCNFTIKIN